MWNQFFFRIKYVYEWIRYPVSHSYIQEISSQFFKLGFFQITSQCWTPHHVRRSLRHSKPPDSKSCIQMAEFYTWWKNFHNPFRAILEAPSYFIFITPMGALINREREPLLQTLLLKHTIVICTSLFSG